MTHIGDKDLSLCATRKAAIPLTVDNKLGAPLECNEVMDDFESYKKSVAATIKSNLNLLKELPAPKNFSIDELTAYLEKQIKCEIEKDKLFEGIVEVSKYAHSISFSLEKYFNNIYKVNKEEKERNMDDLFEISKGFLNSDLPEIFLNDISTSFLVENDFTDLYNKRIRKEHLGLIATRNNKTKFERLCNEHNNWVRDFSQKVDVIGHNRTKLIWYVDINNSNSLEELFKDKFITTKVLDNQVLSQLIESFEKTTSELELLVTKNIDFPCVLKVGADDSIKTLTKMMEIIGS